jgi:hypothetical protein
MAKSGRTWVKARVLKDKTRFTQWMVQQATYIRLHFSLEKRWEDTLMYRLKKFLFLLVWNLKPLNTETQIFSTVDRFCMNVNQLIPVDSIAFSVWIQCNTFQIFFCLKTAYRTHCKFCYNFVNGLLQVLGNRKHVYDRIISKEIFYNIY